MGEIRFVGTGETRGYPYLVCKKILSSLVLRQLTGDFLSEVRTFNLRSAFTYAPPRKSTEYRS